MIIRDAQVHSIHVPLKEPYTIAYETITDVTNHYLVLRTDHEHIGIGCAAPAPEVTGESVEQSLQALEAFASIAVGKSIHELPMPPSKCPSARAAIDLALHDLEARSLGVTVGDLMVRTHLNDSIPTAAADSPIAQTAPTSSAGTLFRETSITIGIASVDDTLERASRLVAQGFRFLKIKGGHDVATDLLRLQSLREKWGDDLTLALDANQGYTLEGIKQINQHQAEIGLVYLEQPTPKHDLALLSEAGRSTDIPVMADESARNVAAVNHLAQLGGVRLINIKLQKMGGLAPAVQIDRVAAEGGMQTMLGCMDESALSIAAALQFGATHPNVAYLDLDGHFDLMDDPFEALVRLDDDGRLATNGLPGLGWESLPTGF